MPETSLSFRVNPTFAFGALVALGATAIALVFYEPRLWPLETGAVLLLAAAALLSDRGLLFATRRRKDVTPRVGFSGLQILAIIIMIMACTFQVALLAMTLR